MIGKRRRSGGWAHARAEVVCSESGRLAQCVFALAVRRTVEETSDTAPTNFRSTAKSSRVHARHLRASPASVRSQGGPLVVNACCAREREIFLGGYGISLTLLCFGVRRENAESGWWGRRRQRRQDDRVAQVGDVVLTAGWLRDSDCGSDTTTPTPSRRHNRLFAAALAASCGPKGADNTGLTGPSTGGRSSAGRPP